MDRFNQVFRLFSIVCMACLPVWVLGQASTANLPSVSAISTNGEPTRASFRTGISRDGGFTFDQQTFPVERLSVFAGITFDPAHLNTGQEIPVFLVARNGNELLMADGSTGLQPWSGRVPDLEVAATVSATGTLDNLKLFEGFIYKSGVMRFYVGYLFDGAVHFTPVAVKFTLDDPGTQPVQPYVSGDLSYWINIPGPSLYQILFGRPDFINEDSRGTTRIADITMVKSGDVSFYTAIVEPTPAGEFTGEVEWSKVHDKSDLLEAHESRRVRGQALVDIDVGPEPETGLTSYLGLWHNTGEMDTQLELDQVITEFEPNDAANREGGYYMTDVEIDFIDGDYHYSGVYLPGDIDYIWNTSGDKAFFDSLLAQRKADGYTLVDIDAEYINGQVIYAGLWHQLGDVPDNQLIDNIRSQQALRDTLDRLANSGGRLLDIETVMHPEGITYTVLVVPGDEDVSGPEEPDDADDPDEPDEPDAADGDVPAIPTGLSLGEVGADDTVPLMWETVGNADSYQVFACNSQFPVDCFITATVTESTAELSVEDTTSHFRVLACNASGCSDLSMPAIIDREADDAPAGPVPAVPVGLNASDDASVRDVSLAWNAVPGADSYAIYRCQPADACILIDSGITQTAYVDTGTSARSFYRVAACNAAGCSAYSAPDEGGNDIDESQPAALLGAIAPPTGVMASQGTRQDAIQVNWQAVANASVYRVYACREGYVGWNEACFLVSGDITSGTSYVFPTTITGFTYFYVEACSDSACSAPSEAAQGYIDCCGTQGWGARSHNDTFKDESSIRLSWDEYPGADHYDIEWCLVGQYNTACASQSHSGGRTYTITGLSADTPYYVKVRACVDGNGCSNWSRERRIITAAASGRPATPTRLRIDTTDPAEIRLTWNAVDNADYYRIFACDRSTGVSLCGDLRLRDESNIHQVGGTRFSVLRNNTNFSLISGEEYDFRVRACNAIGCGSYTEYVSGVLGELFYSELPIIRYPLDANGDDATGNGFDLLNGGQNIPGIRFTDGIDGSAADLSGNATLELPGNFIGELSDAEWSMSFWVYTTPEQFFRDGIDRLEVSQEIFYIGTPLTQKFMSLTTGSLHDDGPGDYKSSGMSFTINDGAGKIETMTAVEEMIFFREWNHIVVSMNGVPGEPNRPLVGQIYLNGERVAEDTFTIKASDLGIPRMSTFAPSVNGEKFKGKVDDIRIFNNALHEGEIDNLRKSAGNFPHPAAYPSVEDQLKTISSKVVPTYGPKYRNACKPRFCGDLWGHIQGMAKAGDGFILVGTYSDKEQVRAPIAFWDERTRDLYTWNFNHPPGFAGGVASANDVIVMGFVNSVQFYALRYENDAASGKVVPALVSMPQLAPNHCEANSEFPSLVYHEKHERYYLWCNNLLFKTRERGEYTLSPEYVSQYYATWRDAWAVEMRYSSSMASTGGRSVVYDPITESLRMISFEGTPGEDNAVINGIANNIEIIYSAADGPENFNLINSRNWHVKHLPARDAVVERPFELVAGSGVYVERTDVIGDRVPLQGTDIDWGPSGRWAATAWMEDGKLRLAYSKRNLRNYDNPKILADNISGDNLSWAPLIFEWEPANEFNTDSSGMVAFFLDLFDDLEDEFRDLIALFTN